MHCVICILNDWKIFTKLINVRLNKLGSNTTNMKNTQHSYYAHYCTWMLILCYLNFMTAIVNCFNLRVSGSRIKVYPVLNLTCSWISWLQDTCRTGQLYMIDNYLSIQTCRTSQLYMIDNYLYSCWWSAIMEIIGLPRVENADDQLAVTGTNNVGWTFLHCARAALNNFLKNINHIYQHMKEGQDQGNK